MRLAGKRAVITGGAHGIGKAIAKRFAGEGAIVVIADCDTSALEQAAAELSSGGAAVGWAYVDVQKKADVDNMVATVLSRHGAIDILVNNAGICAPAPFLEMEEADWDRHLGINLKGTFLCGQAAARVMAEQGSGAIINMSSVNGLAAEADQAHYNASKGGINLLTMSMALDLARLGIRVNSLCPGFIETRLTRPLIHNPAAIAPYLQTIPMGRVGTPEDIADAALFLASDESRYMTGHSLVVDGGQLIKLS